MIAILSSAALAQTFTTPERERAALDDHNRQVDSFIPVPDPKFQLHEGLTRITQGPDIEVGQVWVGKFGDVRHETWVMSQDPASFDGLSFTLTDPGLSYAKWPKPVYPTMFWMKMCESVGAMPAVVAPPLALSGPTITRTTHDLVIEGVVYGQMLRETQTVGGELLRYLDHWVYHEGYADEIQAGSTLTIEQVLPGYVGTGSFLNDNNAPDVRYSRIRWLPYEDEQMGCPTP